MYLTTPPSPPPPPPLQMERLKAASPAGKEPHHSPIRLAMEAVLMILPYLCFSITRPAAWGEDSGERDTGKTTCYGADTLPTAWVGSTQTPPSLSFTGGNKNATRRHRGGRMEEWGGWAGEEVCNLVEVTPLALLLIAVLAFYCRFKDLNQCFALLLFCCCG